MKKGSIVSFGTDCFNCFLSATSWVAFMSSENVKKGIDRDSVIVMVMAFFIPVIFLTLQHIVQ